MKNFAVAPFALPLLFMLAFGQSPIPTHVIGFTNQAFHAWGLDIAIDGGCVKPEGTYRRNIGSIYIPCEAPSGKKNMCILYSDTRCRDEIVAFDHSHGSMFSTLNDNIDTYVGGRVESIKCQVVDKNFPVANTNGHVSTKTQYACPGESCSEFGDCYYFGQMGKMQCTSGRCVRS